MCKLEMVAVAISYLIVGSFAGVAVALFTLGFMSGVIQW